MDKLRSKFSKKDDNPPDEIPTIVVESPADDSRVPYIDEIPTTSSEEQPLTTKPNIKLIRSQTPDKSSAGNEKTEKPGSENVNKSGTSSDVGERRPSLRRNSVSLPNLEDLELQVLRDQHQRRVREVSNRTFIKQFINISRYKP